MATWMNTHRGVGMAYDEMLGREVKAVISSANDGGESEGGADSLPAKEKSPVIASSAARSMLNVENLCVEFRIGSNRIRAVDDVSFSIREGNTVALVGESGSGKSVTSLAIMGLLAKPPAVVSGKIKFFDQSNTEWNFAQLSDAEMQAFRGDRVSMIFQEPMTSLNPVHTVGDQISEALFVHRKMSRRQRHQAVVSMLARVGIPEPERRAKAYPHELSGGMRQRVMIAMALVCGPSLLIADEPTTALDVTIQAQILSDLKRLQSELGMAMLFVTHDLGVVAEIAHSVVVMYAGQIVESGPVTDILRSPRHPYTRALLHAIPRSNVDRDKPLPAIKGTVPDPRDTPVGCRFHPRCQQAVVGLCDLSVPEIDFDESGRAVRCFRWAEIQR